MDHSSGFIAAIAADDEDDKGDYENGRITVTFVSYFQVCKTDLSSEIKKRHCQLYQKHGSIRLWSNNVGISTFSQGLCGNEINEDTFHW